MEGQNAANCYGEFVQLVTDEGIEVGVVQAASASECQNACDSNELCNSASYCPWLGGNCWLKDRILDGSEPTRENGDCRTLYKTPCATPSPPPTSPPPTSAPTPPPTNPPPTSAPTPPTPSPVPSP